jgi:hypothetical protein
LRVVRKEIFLYIIWVIIITLIFVLSGLVPVVIIFFVVWLYNFGPKRLFYGERDYFFSSADSSPELETFSSE